MLLWINLTQVASPRMRKSEALAVLTRRDVIRHFASKQNISVLEAERIVKALFLRLFHQLQQGGRVELRGLGSFATKHLPAYQGHHPRTGAAMLVPSRAKLSFKASKILLAKLNTIIS